MNVCRCCALFGLVACLSGLLQRVKGFRANMLQHVMSSFSQFAKSTKEAPVKTSSKSFSIMQFFFQTGGLFFSSSSVIVACIKRKKKTQEPKPVK